MAGADGEGVENGDRVLVLKDLVGGQLAPQDPGEDVLIVVGEGHRLLPASCRGAGVNAGKCRCE